MARAEVDAGELVVDVGAGDGALTAPLVASGARVLAVELHRGRAGVLRHRFADDPVTVVCTDLTRLRWPRRQFRVVANPPYACTVELLRALLSPHLRLTAADLVLQQGMVQRFVRRPPAWVRKQAHRIEISAGLAVPRRAFRPPPPDDSAVLRVRARRRR